MIWIAIISAGLFSALLVALRQEDVRNTVFDYFMGGVYGGVGYFADAAYYLRNYYLFPCLVGLVALCAGLTLGLGVRWIYPPLGNAIITIVFTAVGLGLLSLTLLLGAATSAFKAALTGVKRTGDRLTSVLSSDAEGILQKAVNKLKPEDQANIKPQLSWLEDLLGFDRLVQLLSIGPEAVYEIIDGAISPVKKLFSWMIAGLFWVFVVAFAALFIPDSASFFWLFAILYGFGIIIYISALKKVEIGNPYQWVWNWTWRAIKVAVVMIVVAVISDWGHNHLRQWFVGLERQGHVAVEESAKDQFGDRFDQMLFQVVEPGPAYESHGWMGFGSPATLALGEILWKTKEREFVEDDRGLQWALYYRQSLIGGLVPDPERQVWYPEAFVRRVSLATRKVKLPVDTPYRGDRLGVPGNTLRQTPRAFNAEAYDVTKDYDGEPYRLCRVADRDRVRWVWIPSEVLERLLYSSPATATRAVMTSATTVPVGVLVPVDPPQPITLGTGDKYYRDLRTRPDLSCWIPLPHDLSSQEVVAKWTNPATSRTYLRVRGPQWWPPHTIVHIWVDE